MPEFVLTVARFGFLILLWIFVFTVVGVIRKDLFAGVRSKGIVASPRGVGGTVPSAPPPAKAARSGKAARQLLVTAGQLNGTRITLSEAPITIGRAGDSTLVITDDFASTRHARLVPQDGQWFVEDLGSTNGTYLGHDKVSGLTFVPLGVPIRIGRTSLELRP
ncbi:FHA domain-containing protein [Actinoplanes sp. NPDC049596]|uniref:FHA domain-containing protein FhaB/FipA n=1 Tax=unclassified Actinoplanes TaxID=2626549 RepID=UPI00343B22AC